MRIRNQTGLGFLIVFFAVIAFVITAALETKSLADPSDPQQVTHGKSVYTQHCASCHGEKLEGQVGWRKRLANGRMPAPPHDASGHTWHHSDTVLFNISKHGMLPDKTTPAGYKSDMPAFSTVLSDEEIWASLAYIKSSWPATMRKEQDQMNVKHKH